MKKIIYAKVEYIPLETNRHTLLAGNAFTVYISDNYIVVISIFNQQNRSYGKDFSILASDTVYKLTPLKELHPVSVRKQPVQEMEPKTLISHHFITDRFVFWRKQFQIDPFKQIGAYRTTVLMYDFETGQLNEIKLINKDFDSGGIYLFEGSNSPENTGRMLLNVAELFEADKAGKIKGKLKELLKPLNVEDNPILIKIK